MQICVRDHVEVHPQKKKEVLYFVKKHLGEIGEVSDQKPEDGKKYVFLAKCIENAVLREKYCQQNRGK